jgi:hypothetical protein
VVIAALDPHRVCDRSNNGEILKMRTAFLWGSVVMTATLFNVAPSLAATDADCTAMWVQADANGDGTLTDGEADRFSAWMRIANKSVPDGAITQAIFLENCKADVFVTAAVEEGAPFKGANSFTEAQAKDRVVSAGYGTVSALTKDDDGIWRGTAMKDGKSVNVAVDYKGNVVGN